MTLPLAGMRALVTAGPTQERLDPVRYLSNDSSGKQGYAIASALRDAGASVTLVSGKTALSRPAAVKFIAVQTAQEMHDAVMAEVMSEWPVDIAVYSAAVSDVRPQNTAAHKLKKSAAEIPSEITLTENPDILAAVSQHPTKRPTLVVGFAAETEQVVEQASAKRLRKKCDWIVANDVSGGQVFDAEQNQIHLITEAGVDSWPSLSKQEVANRLIERMITHLSHSKRKAL